MGKAAAQWFREQHVCNAYCRDGQHAQMVFQHDGLEGWAKAKRVSERCYAIRALALEPAPEFDPQGYYVRQWDRHGRPHDNSTDVGTPYLLIYEYADYSP